MCPSPIRCLLPNRSISPPLPSPAHLSPILPIRRRHTIAAAYPRRAVHPLLLLRRGAVLRGNLSLVWSGLSPFALTPTPPPPVFQAGVATIDGEGRSRSRSTAGRRRTTRGGRAAIRRRPSTPPVRPHSGSTGPLSLCSCSSRKKTTQDSSIFTSASFDLPLSLVHSWIYSEMPPSMIKQPTLRYKSGCQFCLTFLAGSGSVCCRFSQCSGQGRQHVSSTVDNSAVSK
ncbi:uncharacterized protein [Triticum aestivum]|uniref:uncharacterized protein n=1 Tax=Triticum aestivum TaxID=4565 RepID=UPI001D005D66|nr:uncharacterized protein LOC123096939 [Triticum aestivum]